MAAPPAEWTIEGLSQFREALGLTQQGMADLVGLSRPTLAKIEDGSKTKHSTILSVYERLHEKYGEEFDVLDLSPSGELSYAIRFKRKPNDKQRPQGKARDVEWRPALDALAGQVIRVAASKDVYVLDSFHDALVEILDAYETLTGRSLMERRYRD